MTRVNPNFADTTNKILAWAEARNLVKGATAIDQYMKLSSEVGELADAIAKKDEAGIKDGIGDAFVVLTIMSAQTNSVDALMSASGHILPTFAAEISAKESFISLNDKIGQLGSTIVESKNRLEHDGRYVASDIKASIKRLMYLSSHFGLTLEECAASAYEEIKNRKGVMFNGTFVKSTDSRYEDVMAQIEALKV